VPFEAQAQQQLCNAAQLPFIFRWIAAMPDVHMGIGATVRLRHPDQRRDRPRGGWGRYRMWDGCRAHQPHRVGPSRKSARDSHRHRESGIESRKDADGIDETPAAYKPIDAVMAAQSDLVEVVHTLHQVVCVKG